MPDNYTEISTRSWGGRLGGSLKGILVGLLMVIASVPLLWWNEGRTVERHKALAEGAGLVVSVDSREVDAGNEGQLIHTSGTADSRATIRDPQFPLAAKALQLRREVEMYQWQERTETSKEKNLGGSETTTTTYHYDKGWSSNYLDSGQFRKPEGHRNPGEMLYRSHTETSTQAYLGAFRLTPDQVGQLSNHRPIPLQDIDFQVPGRPYQAMGNELYIGEDPAAPQVGDLRIRFFEMAEAPVSVIGKQQQNGLTSYLPEAGSSILIVRNGIHSAETLFKAAEDENRILAWILRFVGFLLMFFGLRTILGPLSVLGDVIPVIGSIIAFGSGTLALLIALPLTLVTIAIAWVFYRPLLAIGLIAVAIATIVGSYWMKQGKTPLRPAPSQSESVHR